MTYVCCFPIFPSTNRNFYCSYLVHSSLWYTECVKINNILIFFHSSLDHEELHEELIERIVPNLETLDFKSNEANGWDLENFFFNILFIYYFWLCWVFVSVRGLSLVVASGGHSSSRCAGLSLSRPLLLQSTGSRRAGSVVVAHGPSCSTACGIFPDQGSNPCPLHWQADSQPLRHQGSPGNFFVTKEWEWGIAIH